jgi:hypothetical protein
MAAPPHGLTRLLCWHPKARKTFLLAAVFAAPIVAVVGLLYAHVIHGVWTGTQPLNDFFALWGWSAMIHATPHALEMYDPAAMKAFLHAQDAAFTSNYPFAYPPSFLLLIWPLALLPRAESYVLFVLVTLALYLAAVGRHPWRRPIILLALVAPSTVLTITAGQNGLLTAALLIGGCRLLGRRPVVAGVLFGLLSCKPQLGVLIPVALLAAGMWRVIAAAVATVLASVAASSAAFGWAMWGRWVHALLGLTGFVSAQPQLYRLMPTVSANLHLLGAPAWLTVAGQLAAAGLAAAGVWWCWRRGPGRVPTAVLQVSTFLATPYAFFYDLPILTNALLELVLDRLETNEAFSAAELLAMAAAVVLPLAMTLGYGSIPWGGLVLPPLFALTLWRVRAARPAAG